MSDQQQREEGRASGMDRRAMLGMAAMGVGGLAAGAMAQTGRAGMRAADGGSEGSNELVVLWTSADPDVAERMGLMYTHAAMRNKWFEKVRLLVWGPAQRTLVGDKDLREKVRLMEEEGVRLQACLACADSYGIAEDLREAGFEVIYMGEPLTGFLKNPEVAVLTV
jgi:hypothetical protein